MYRLDYSTDDWYDGAPDFDVFEFNHYLGFGIQLFRVTSLQIQWLLESSTSSDSGHELEGDGETFRITLDFTF